MTPSAFLFLLLTHEAPVIAKTPKLETEWRADLEAATTLDAQVGVAGALVGPEVDTAILDAIRWYEARLRQTPKDGDCHPKADLREKVGYRIVCTAIGPMQVQLIAFKAVVGTPDAALAGLSEALTKPTEADLRDPETGVRAGYGGLLRWKGLCGGSPARWITAYGWGKCPPARTLDRESIRRCELVEVLLASRGQMPGWKCGHEGRRISDASDRRFLKWARENAHE